MARERYASAAGTASWAARAPGRVGAGWLAIIEASRRTMAGKPAPTAGGGSGVADALGLAAGLSPKLPLGTRIYISGSAACSRSHFHQRPTYSCSASLVTLR